MILHSSDLVRISQSPGVPMAGPARDARPSPDPRESFIRAATRDARRAGTAVVLFGLWLALTALGKDLRLAEHWGWQGFLLALFTYSVLSVASLAALVHGGATVLTAALAQSSVERRLMPYWLLLLIATASGIWLGISLTDSPLEGAWLGTSLSLSGMLAPTAVALFLEARTMRALPSPQKSTMLK